MTENVKLIKTLSGCWTMGEGEQNFKSWYLVTTGVWEYLKSICGNVEPGTVVDGCYSQD